MFSSTNYKGVKMIQYICSRTECINHDKNIYHKIEKCPHSIPHKKNDLCIGYFCDGEINNCIIIKNDVYHIIHDIVKIMKVNKNGKNDMSTNKL